MTGLPRQSGFRLRFQGPAYSENLDGERLGNQRQRILSLMLDGVWRTLREIATGARAPEASLSSVLRQLTDPENGGYVKNKRRRGDPKLGLWEYQILAPSPDAIRPAAKRRAALKELHQRIAELEAQVRQLGGTP